MEAIFLPLLGISLVVLIVLGFAHNRPILEEDEIKAVRPLLRLMRNAEEGLADDDAALLPFAREVDHSLARGYLRRSSRGLLVLTDVGDRLRRTGKLEAPSVAGR